MIKEWESLKLEDVLDYIQPTNHIVASTKYNDDYKTPVLTAGKSFILGYTNEKNNIFDRLPTIIFDDFTTAIKFVNFKFKVKSSAMKILVPTCDLVNVKYVFYFMKTLRVNVDTHKRYWISIFSKLPIRITSLPEQDQIVSKIEQLFSDLDNATDNFKKAKDQLKVYRQSVLKYAFEGEYSRCEETWKTESIGEICKVVSGNTPKGVNDIFTDGDIPFYKVADMNSEGNELFMRKAKINLSADDCKKLKLKTFPKGTVIFPKRGGAILTNKKRILSKESAFDLNLMGVIPGENVRERFLFDWFLALDLGTLYDGSNVPQINHSDIEPLKFPQISIEVQDDVIKEVESRLSVCDKMEETINTSIGQAEALRQSILKKAFEGKLTEEWRRNNPELISGENSAKALLEKIKRERESLKNTKKRKK